MSQAYQQAPQQPQQQSAQGMPFQPHVNLMEACSQHGFTLVLSCACISLQTAPSQPLHASNVQGLLGEHRTPWRAGDPATTEKYWRLLELMRQEFLADIAEYYNCMAPNIAGAQQPAYASKLAKMKSVIQRLSVSARD